MQDLHKLWIFAVLATITALSIAPNVSALGIGPGIIEIPYEPGKTKTFTIKIVNNERKDTSADITFEGELADFITAESSKIIFTKDDAYKKVRFKIRMPEHLENPGPHETKIFIKEHVKRRKNEEGTQIVVDIAYYAIVRVNVPYPGKYAKIRLIAPKFDVGKTSAFGIEIQNLGTETLFAESSISILTPLEVAIASLAADQVPVNPREKEMVTITWTPEKAGRFRAIADVVYGDGFARDEKEISVGKAHIKIMDITSRNFRLGEINRFDIVLKSEWNEPIKNVYAIVEISGKDGTLYSQYRSGHVLMPSFGTKSIPAYLETNKLNEGEYVMKIILHYLGSKQENEFNISIQKNSISVNLPTGRVVSSGKKEKSEEIENIYELISIIIIMVIASNIIIFRKLRQKNN